MKDIAAGQEVFVSYGDAEWFEDKNISYIDVDYASAQWRPELHPLPCRQNVVQRKGRDGRLRYIALADISSGTVIEISVCLEMPTIAVDKFSLWDYALTGLMAHMHAGCHQISKPSRANYTHLMFSADPREERATGQRPESVLLFTSLLTHFECCNALHTHSSRDPSARFLIDRKHGCTHINRSASLLHSAHVLQRCSRHHFSTDSGSMHTRHICNEPASLPVLTAGAHSSVVRRAHSCHTQPARR